MAEARAAVQITRTHTSENALSSQEVDEVYNDRLPIVHSTSPMRSLTRSSLSLLFRLRNWLLNSLWPGYLPAYCVFVSLLTAVVLNSESSSWLRSNSYSNVVWTVDSTVPFTTFFPRPFRVFYLAFLTGIALAFAWSFACRMSLRFLLTYKGWRNETGRKVSTRTKLWAVAVKLLSGSNPLTYSFQSALPRLPVPSLRSTCEKYLRSVKPLMTAEEFEKISAQAKDFLAKDGPRLQRYLAVKSWIAPNYVTDWWEKYVYLRSRSSLMIGSNYYIFSSSFFLPTKRPAARAGVVIHNFMRFKIKLEREELKPMLMRNMIPLCMWQYNRIFNTTRVPGKELDVVENFSRKESRHVAVLCNGFIYTVDVYHPDGSLLTPFELQTQFKWVLDDASEREADTAEARLPALTGENRTTWAAVREKFLLHGRNQQSLRRIESAIMVLVFDNDVFADGSGKLDVNRWGKSLLHGHGADRWFDKSLSLIVAADGRVGVNAEHSYADALVVAHAYEFALTEEKIMDDTGIYSNNGLVAGNLESIGRLAKPERLTWNLPSECKLAIDSAFKRSMDAIANVDLNVYPFDAYGKGFIKKAMMSPDAYLQMALQLAYYRDQKEFAQTYEASMTRFFLHGRTETVRPVSEDSCAWVKSMCDPTVSNETRRELLRKACNYHNSWYFDCMLGQGVDRHLFALYVVSVGTKRESDFLRTVLSRPWKLSTSQTPQQQDPRPGYDMNNPAYMPYSSPGGGFGPVADDGYGVSYMILQESHFYFHISCHPGCGKTKSLRFGDNIAQALMDMKAIFD